MVTLASEEATRKVQDHIQPNKTGLLDDTAEVSCLTKPDWYNDKWTKTSATVVHGNCVEEIPKVLGMHSVDLWIVDSPFNVLENDKVDPELLDKLAEVMYTRSKPTAVGIAYVSKDGEGTTYDVWNTRLTDAGFRVRYKQYFRITNKKSAHGQSGHKFNPLGTVQEALVFSMDATATKDFHLNYKDPRIDWLTDFMDEYVLDRNF